MRVTLSLPDELVAWARVEAARAGKSLSRWIGEHVAEWMDEDRRPMRAGRLRKTRPRAKK
jgi:hypothetical protein